MVRMNPGLRDHEWKDWRLQGEVGREQVDQYVRAVERA